MQTAHCRLDLPGLARRLTAHIVRLDALADISELRWAVEHVRLAAPEDFSALTLKYPKHRVVVVNDGHSPERQANSIAHELAHLILEHPACSIFGRGQCRDFDDEVEHEAGWLGGELLVPCDAARRIGVRGEPLDEAAARFGVSPALMRWRVNISGAKQITAARQRG